MTPGGSPRRPGRWVGENERVFWTWGGGTGDLCALNIGTLGVVLAERYEFVERCSTVAAPFGYLLPGF